jgi:endoglucanase
MPIRQFQKQFIRRARSAAAAALFFGGTVEAQPAMTPKPSPPQPSGWDTAERMGIGVNIGNTLENTTTWETGWGNPPITKAFVDSLAAHGFKTVRVPVAWDTYAHEGKIDPAKIERVAQVVDWITSDGMFCVINIHWDGGWIDSDDKKKFGKSFHTFSPKAEQKFRSYWTQIATYFADRDEHLIFEGLNEESNFGGDPPDPKAYATLGRVNQLFVDTVRATGGNNATRPLIIAGYTTDIGKTATDRFILPHDTVPHELLLSIHYYTPWPFAGMAKDESWGKMRATWGTKQDVAELRDNFDKLEAYSKRKDIPIFLGEFGADGSKDPRSRARWMLSVALTARSKGMVPVLWDTGHDVLRKPPFALSPELSFVLDQVHKLEDGSSADEANR